jgi:hypothetical protein
MDYLPDIEIDELTGKPKIVQLQQNSMVYNPLNRNLLYTKAEIDAKINDIPKGGTGNGQVNSIVPGDGIAVDDTDPTNPIVGATSEATANGVVGDLVSVHYSAEAEFTT